LTEPLPPPLDRGTTPRWGDGLEVIEKTSEPGTGHGSIDDVGREVVDAGLEEAVPCRRLDDDERSPVAVAHPADVELTVGHDAEEVFDAGDRRDGAGRVIDGTRQGSDGDVGEESDGEHRISRKGAVDARLEVIEQRRVRKAVAAAVNRDDGGAPDE